MTQAEKLILENQHVIMLALDSVLACQIYGTDVDQPAYSSRSKIAYQLGRSGELMKQMEHDDRRDHESREEM